MTYRWAIVLTCCLMGGLEMLWQLGAGVTQSSLQRHSHESDGVTSGVVLDEHGSPLSGVRILAADGARKAPLEEITDGLGRFEFHGATEATVTIEPCPLGDRYSPRIVELPKGESGLIFRRTELAAAAFLNLRLVDSESGSEISKGRIVLFEPLGGFSVYGMDVVPGPMEVGIQVRRGLRFIVRADGYQSIEGAFDDISAPAGSVREVSLRFKRGFRETFKIVNAHSAAPLAGVSIMADGVRVGRTDAFGIALIDLAVFPEEVSFSRCDLEGESFPTVLLNRRVQRNVDWRVSPAVTLIRL